MSKKADFSYESQMKLFKKIVFFSVFFLSAFFVCLVLAYENMTEEEKQKFIEVISLVEIPKDDTIEDSNQPQYEYEQNDGASTTPDDTSCQSYECE